MKNKKFNDNTEYFEEEIEWRKKMNIRDTAKEILESMSYKETEDLLTPIMENRIDGKNLFDKKYKQISRLVNKYYAPDTFEFDFAVNAIWLLKFLKGDIENQDQLKNLERYWIFNENRKPVSKLIYHSDRINLEAYISEAKQIPLETLCLNPCRRSGANTLVSLCPFHKEKTPSFTIFINSNTFYCFGCNAKGDSIAFYQKIYGVNFVEAVKSMTRQY